MQVQLINSKAIPGMSKTNKPYVRVECTILYVDHKGETQAGKFSLFESKPGEYGDLVSGAKYILSFTASPSRVRQGQCDFVPASFKKVA